MDLSIEAIEADLALAEVNIGRPLERLALARAQVRATLRGSSSSATAVEPVLLPFPQAPKAGEENIHIGQGEYGSTYVVPAAADETERIEAAAHLLGIPLQAFRTMLGADVPQRHVLGDLTEAEAVQLGEEAVASIDAPSPVPDEDPGEIEIDDDDEDFFAEARKERKP